MRNEQGQSTIEFALTMILFLAIFFFYFQLCMTLAFGSYVHYATFMSARALFAAGGGNSADKKEQITRAKSVLIYMVKKSAGEAGTDKFPSIAKGVGSGDPPGGLVGEGSQFQAGNPAYSWMQGVRYTFMGRLFIIPIAGLSSASRESDPGELKLTAESWLGRSPTNAECSLNVSGNLIDNGC